MKRVPMLVLAGGFGTRLRSVVSDVPKPLAPVEGKPFLQYLMEGWVAQGVTELTFLLHHQPAQMETFLAARKNASRPGTCAIRSLTEPHPMGTGGAIAFAVRELSLSGTFLVTNADTWLGSGVAQVFGTAAPAMAVVRVDNSERYGSVAVQEGKVVEFREKQDSAGAGWINAGLYHLHSDLFRGWDGQPFPIERQLFPRLASDGHLNAVALNTDFIDIGIPEDYHRFDRWIRCGRGNPL